MPVTDRLRGMGYPAYRMAYRPWSRTVRVLREPSGRFYTGFFAYTPTYTVHSRGEGAGKKPVLVRGDVMLTIDAQVHAYERNHPGRPWVGVLPARRRSPATRWWRPWTRSGSTARSWSRRSRMYRYDASYALEVHAAASRPVRPGQAGRPERPRRGRDDRRLGGHRRARSASAS